MKKQILEALKAKFEGVSEAVLSRIADKLAKTVLKEEDVATAVEGVTFQSVLDSYGDSRATEASQTAVGNYEKKHGLKDGQKVQGGAPAASEPAQGDDTQPDPNASPLAKQLLVEIKALRGEVATMKGDKVITTRKQRLTDVLANAPAKFKERIEKDFDRLTFTDEEDFTSWLGDIQTDTEDAIAEEKARGSTFGYPGGSNKKPTTKEASDAEIDAVVGSM